MITERTRRLSLAAIAALVALFFFRLAFGLSSEFFFEDETQIFLIGLKHYATGVWPFFGADVVWTRSEIPGALQGLLVGAPFSIVAQPEAPFVLLNVLSFTALCTFSWYVTKRLQWLPAWLVWGWFLTVPWTLQFSTHVINPSYVLFGAILFFVGFLETVPVFSIGLIAPATAHFMMGAAVTWVMQVHMSWPLLLPYAGMAWLSRTSDGWRSLLRNALTFVAGACVPGVLLVPTLLQYGTSGGSGGVLRNLHVNWVKPSIAVTTFARLLSFASLEINRFIETDGPKRLEFFMRHLWLAPLAVIVWLIGVVQPLWMAVELVRPTASWPKPDAMAQWRSMRWLLLSAVVLTYASYSFVMEPAQAHAFYVLAPIALCFAAYCWTFVDSPRMRRVAAGILAMNIAFHAGLAIAQAPERSLYKRRDIVVAAIRDRQPEILGHRRPFAVDAGPYQLTTAIPHDPVADLAVLRSTYAKRTGSAVHWTVTIENRSPRVAYRDLLYYATYRHTDGTETVRHEFIKDILRACESRVVEINDGYVTEPYQDATFRIVAAEALVPSDTRQCTTATASAAPLR